MKKVLLSFTLAVSLYSQEIVETSNEEKPFILDYSYLESINKGIKRDFYINEYLKKDISSSQAYETLKLIDEMSEELFINFAKKYKDDETLAVAQCLRMDTKDLVSTYADCIKVGLSLKEASSLSSVDIDLISQKLENKYPTFVKKLKVISSSIPFTKLIVQKQELYYDIFFDVSNEFREQYFNYKLPKRTFQKIFKNKESFDKFLEISIKNSNLDKLNKSFLEVNDIELNANSSFLLALNALKFNEKQKALIYLTNALKKDNSEAFKSKVLFYSYIVSLDKGFLEQIIQSNELSFYYLFSQELLNLEKKDLSTLLKNEAFEGFTKKFDKKKKAFLFSLLKTQANFNVNKISKDYKISLSQLKQKSLKSISILLNEEYDLQKQFILEENLKYTNIHVNNLEKTFKDPIKLYLAFNSQNSDLKTLKSFKSFDINNLNSLIAIEKLDSSTELKEFISYYYLYTNSLSKKRKDKVSFSSIFENLVQSNQINNEKALN